MKRKTYSDFKPAWWLKNPHAQTIWPTFLRREVSIDELWERIELPDGDFLDLVWDKQTFSQEDKPIVILLHGLGGNIHSSYAKGLMKALSRNGYRSVFMHFRGCSGVPNRLVKSYHAGETKDLAFVINQLKQKYTPVQIAAVGISLGGNALLKWLGETGTQCPLQAAVAVSVPFDLGSVSTRLMQGVSKSYQWWLIKKLKRDIEEKFRQIEPPFELGQLSSVKDFWQFDALITAPVNGFADVHTYYKKSSCRQYLSSITIPTLMIHSIDDPFMESDVIPKDEELAEAIQLELVKGGGHVGFITGSLPFCPKYWLEKRIPNFLRNCSIF